MARLRCRGKLGVECLHSWGILYRGCIGVTGVPFKGVVQGV